MNIDKADIIGLVLSGLSSLFLVVALVLKALGQ